VYSLLVPGRILPLYLLGYASGVAAQRRDERGSKCDRLSYLDLIVITNGNGVIGISTAYSSIPFILVCGATHQSIVGDIQLNIAAGRRGLPTVPLGMLLVAILGMPLAVFLAVFFAVLPLGPTPEPGIWGPGSLEDDGSEVLGVVASMARLDAGSLRHVGVHGIHLGDGDDDKSQGREGKDGEAHTG
jgi:hypothetical protein